MVKLEFMLITKSFVIIEVLIIKFNCIVEIRNVECIVYNSFNWMVSILWPIWTILKMEVKLDVKVLGNLVLVIAN